MSLPSLHDIQARLGGKVCGEQWRGPAFGHPRHDTGLTITLRSDGRGFVVNVFQPDEDWRDQHDQLRAAFGLETDQVRASTPAERRVIREKIGRAKAQREGAQLARVANLIADGNRPAPGCPVSEYFTTARGIPPAVVAMAVNAGAVLQHKDNQGRFSVLAIAHRHTALRAAQITKIHTDGSGKRGDPSRLTFGPLKGAACRLFKLAGDTLAVGEGVETALAFTAIRKVPCWATFGAGNLAAFEPPAGVRTLIVAADGDAPGIAAADALCSRLKRRVRVIIAPAPTDLDWLDVLNHESAPCR
jgi:hypothetical protein